MPGSALKCRDEVVWLHTRKFHSFDQSARSQVILAKFSKRPCRANKDAVAVNNKGGRALQNVFVGHAHVSTGSAVETHPGVGSILARHKEVVVDRCIAEIKARRHVDGDCCELTFVLCRLPSLPASVATVDVVRETLLVDNGRPCGVRMPFQMGVGNLALGNFGLGVTSTIIGLGLQLGLPR